MESFWGTLKNELIHHRRYRTRAQAIQEIEVASLNWTVFEGVLDFV